MTLIGWIRSKLIDDAGNWWRYWSVRLGAVASTLVGVLLAYPEIVVRTLNELPPEIRSAFPPAFGVAMFVVVTIVRLYKQKSKPDGAGRQ